MSDSTIDRVGFQLNLEKMYGIEVGSPLSQHYTKAFQIVWKLSKKEYPLNIDRIEEDLENVQNQLSDLDKLLTETTSGVLTIHSKISEMRKYLSHIGVSEEDIMHLTDSTLRYIESKYSENEEIVEISELLHLSKVLQSLENRLLRLRDGSDNKTVTPAIPMLTGRDALFTSSTLFYGDFRYLAPEEGKKLYSVGVSQATIYFITLLLKDKEMVKDYLKGKNYLIAKWLKTHESEVVSYDKFNIITALNKILSGVPLDFSIHGTDKIIDTDTMRELTNKLHTLVQEHSTKEDIRTPEGKKVLSKQLSRYYSAVHSDILSHILVELDNYEEWGMKVITTTGNTIVVEVDDKITEEEIRDKFTTLYAISSPDDWYVPRFYIDNPLERIIHIIDDM